jgi:hypothetical protein
MTVAKEDRMKDNNMQPSLQVLRDPGLERRLEELTYLG